VDEIAYNITPTSPIKIRGAAVKRDFIAPLSACIGTAVRVKEESRIKSRMPTSAKANVSATESLTDSTFQCSPALHRQPGETCIPKNALEKMRRTWNKLHPTEKIKGSSESNNNGGIWKQIRGAMKRHYQCNTEYCIVEKMPGIDKKERDSMRAYFKPAKPDAWDKKPTTWLDSFNIEDVMNQYEEAYPHFEFIGPVPIDFDAPDGAWGRCIVDELCKLDIRKAGAAGTTMIGIIFNLDAHDEPGSHWVCAFIDIPKSAAYYFDSYAVEPPNEVKVLLKRLHDQGIANIYYNDVRHQRKGSECGMYCLYTIISLVAGRSFYNVCRRVIDDDTMNSLRDIIFATEKPRKNALEKALGLLEGETTAAPTGFKKPTI
jgi:hypothetical protein